MSSESHGCVNIEILSSLHLRSTPQDDGRGSSTSHDGEWEIPRAMTGWAVFRKAWTGWECVSGW